MDELISGDALSDPRPLSAGDDAGELVDQGPLQEDVPLPEPLPESLPEPLP